MRRIMDWLELTVRVDAECVEATSEVLGRYVHGGVVVEEDITPFSDGTGYRINLDKPVVVKGYLPLDDTAHHKQAQIERDLWHLGLLRPVSELSSKVLREDEWQNSWKRHFHVHRVGRRIVIKPSWQEYAAQADDLVIELDPGSAFGSGLHPTTQMCLIELENVLRGSERVLDIGTGSGILAIAAAKAGAEAVLALDVDSVAVEVARRNVEANRVEKIVRVQLGTLPWTGENDGSWRGGFHLVVANIISRVIVELADHLVAAVRPSGVLLVSGIIEEHVGWVEESICAAGIGGLSRRKMGDWFAVVGQKAADGRA
ncbi:MAG: 50S ribosomal protein L11 methyltransferase [Chloroflexi bacterium]|nr:50S ribosomal protein L11 methyltransferase [Chloroflexota bacterium]